MNHPQSGPTFYPPGQINYSAPPPATQAGGIDASRLSTWTQLIDAAINEVQQNQHRVRKAMDYILGEEPERVTGKSDLPAPNCSGQMGECYYRLAQLAGELITLTEQVRRLERVVG